MRAVALVVLVLPVAPLACATVRAPTAAPARSAARLDVDVSLLPDEEGRVGGVSLRYCTRGAPWPNRIAPEDRRALPFLVSAVDDAGRALTTDAEGVRTRELTGCAHVVVDVGRLSDTIADRDLALRAGDDLIITPDLWLWRPEPFDDARLFVRVDAANGEHEQGVAAHVNTAHDDAGPADVAHSDGGAREGSGFDALVPWDVDADGRSTVDAATFRLKSDAAFGRFDIEDVDAAGARFRIARLDDGRAPPQFSAWLTASANAVATVLGRYPLPRVNVLVVPTHVTRPIVVGFFSRGGGPTATFFVGEGAPEIDDADLEATGRWALTHELAHPLLPPVRSEDAWLNEGLATWHQDLLARRAGMLVDDDAYWRELERGLATGAARAAEDHLSLDDASTQMHALGAYQHVYWAGVGVMLAGEVEAQKSGASLDDLVRALRRRIPSDDRPRGAKDLLGAVAADATDPAGAAAATALLTAYASARARPFPDTAPILEALGVSIDGMGGVHLDDAAPLAAIRRAITAQHRHDVSAAR